MFKVRILIAFIMLIICSVEDFKTGYVNVVVIVISEIAAAASYSLNSFYELKSISALENTLSLKNVWRLILEMVSGADTLDIIVASLVILIMAIAFTMGMGIGDIYIIAALLIIVGAYITFGALFIAFTLAGLYALILKIAKREETGRGFPFVPFITAGFIMACQGYPFF